MTRIRKFHSVNRGSLIALAIASAAAIGVGGSASASTYVWTGAASTDWTVGGNWTGATPPPADSLTADIAQFNAASYPNQPALTASRRIGGLIIDSTSGALDIGGPGTLSIGSAGITMNAGAAAAIIDALVFTNYASASPATAGQNTQTWVNNSANSLTLTAVFTHQPGSILNVGGTGAIHVANVNTNGILGTWATFGTGSATKYATNLTNAAGGTIGGLTGTVATNLNSLADNTANYELTNTGPNALTSFTLSSSVTSNTIRYSGTAQAIQMDAGLTTKGILNAGPGKLTLTRSSQPNADVDGVILDAPETVFNAAGGDIELGAPVLSVSAADSTITVTGAGKVGFNTVTNLGTGNLQFAGFGDSTGTPSSKVMIGASHTLTFNATNGDIRVFSPIVDNQDATPSAVVINTTGANRVRFTFANNANQGTATYSGGLTVTPGSNFQIVGNFFGSDSSLGTGTFTIGAGASIFSQATFTAASNNASVWQGDFSVTNANGPLSLGTGQITLAPSNPLATSITITNNGLNDPFNTNGLELGPITDNGRGIGLTLATGSIRLNGADTFSGPLTIQNGKVFLANDKATTRNTVIIMNAGSTLQLGSRSNQMIAGLQDGTIPGGEVIQLSSGDPLFFVGSGNYTFSGNITGGGNPSNINPVMAGTGTQTLSGSNSYTYAGFKSGFTAIYSGTLKLDFSAPTAPATNILYHDVQAQFLSLGSGRLLVNGSSTGPASQSFADITVGSTGQGRPFNGSSTLQVVNNGQDVALKMGNVFLEAGGGVNFVLPTGSQTSTNGILTTASNLNGILSNGSGGARATAVVTSAGSTDWAVSGATHTPPGVTVETDAGTYDALDGNLDIWTGTSPGPAIGQAVSFNTINGTAPAGVEPGHLFFVVFKNSVGGSNYFTVSPTPGGAPMPNNTSVSGTLSIDLAGNLAPFTAYNTTFNGLTDVITDNYLLTGSFTAPVSGFLVQVNTLKIANTAPGVLDFTGQGNGLLQLIAGSVLFTGSADYSINGDPTYRLNGANNELSLNQYGTGKLTINVKIRNNPLTKNGPGTVALTNPLDDFNTLNLNAGTVSFNALHTLGIGTLIYFNGGTLQYATGYTGTTDITFGGGSGGNADPDPQTAVRTLRFGPGGATIDTNGNDVTLSGNIGGGDANGFFGGGVSISTPTGGLTKAGAGKLTLLGQGSYGGGTIVNAGTLLANNTAGSATGSGDVTVNGGTLGGSGTIAGRVIGGSSAHTIAPSAGLAGNTSTTLTVGGLTTSSNSTLMFNLTTPGTSSVSDRINVTGSNGLTLSGGSLAIGAHSTGVGSLGYYKLIQYSGSIQGTGASSLILPPDDAVTKVAYRLSTSHDAGFVDVHRGLLGDANDDGLVNFADFVLLSNNFTATNAGWGGADFNGDNLTNFADFVILSNNFGNTIGAAEEASGLGAASGVPEPTSLALLGAGLLGVIGARRRVRA